ncbi:MAG: CDP-glycerol glycerophosphotransferase [Planctomycetia bacterium]|nr:CDP-glycerol glycerophosphotransferase [Planctomycetia bacterium]
MGKTKILFKMFYLYHKTAYDPLIDIFSSDSQYDVAISLTNEVTRKFGIFNKKESNNGLTRSLQKNIRISKEGENFDIVIVPDVVDEKKYDKALLCMVYHGLTFTKTVTYRELEKHKPNRYIIFAESDYAVEQLDRSGSLHNSEVYKIGYPKLDPLYQIGLFNKDDILKSLGLDVEKQTILYAPTYKPTSVYELKDAIFETTKNYNLIIKLHHYAWKGKYARHSQHKIFEKRIKKYDHAVIIPFESYSILPYLFIADTLVSEASGAITEFLATGKIGVIYNIDDDQLRHTDGQRLLVEESQEFLKDSFVHINSPEELRAGITKALNPSPEMIKTAQKDCTKYFYKLDGKAALRAKTMIEKLYNEGTHFNIVN